jgi:hypothetical protein
LGLEAHFISQKPQGNTKQHNCQRWILPTLLRTLPTIPYPVLVHVVGPVGVVVGVVNEKNNNHHDHRHNNHFEWGKRSCAHCDCKQYQPKARRGKLISKIKG